MDGGETSVGMESLRRLKSTNAPLFLSPSEELAKEARIVSQYLFSALKTFSSNCPLPHLVTEGFDAEQIWPQIETQSEPLIKTLTNQLKKFEKNPEEITKQFNLVSFDKKDEKLSLEEESKDFDGEEENDEGSDDDEEVEKEESEDEDEDEDIEDDEDEEEEGEKKGVEDKFLKINELEEYLNWDEEQEYGTKKEEKKKRKRRGNDEDSDEDDEENDEEEDEDDDDDDEFGLMGVDDGEDDEEDARYEDFFNATKKSSQKKKSKLLDGSDGSDMDDGPTNNNNDQKKKILSTHEKEQEKFRSEIERMEKSNLDPKDWNMQGEITATKRAKNSALEVDLDFEHNVRPPPVITEEVTATLEELIQKRILEERFDDVQRSSTQPSRAKKESKELDENKSKKGLAEVYEEEYVQKTGLVSTALSFSDEQKKESSMLFKRLCLKLDALSHFHFTPKPVIEDMSIQANVPALAMEEIAPVAVSDAAMLAPEEVFSGKGDIKEETELSQAERKRRRAKKKAKFKAESAKKLAKKGKPTVTADHPEENKES